MFDIEYIILHLVARKLWTAFSNNALEGSTLPTHHHPKSEKHDS